MAQLLKKMRLVSLNDFVGWDGFNVNENQFVMALNNDGDEKNSYYGVGYNHVDAMKRILNPRNLSKVFESMEFCDNLTRLMEIKKCNKIDCTDEEYTCSGVFPCRQNQETEHFNVKLIVWRSNGSANMTTIVKVTEFSLDPHEIKNLNSNEKRNINGQFFIKLKIANIKDFRKVAITFALEVIKLVCDNADVFDSNGPKTQPEEQQPFVVLMSDHYKRYEVVKKKAVASIINEHIEDNSGRNYSASEVKEPMSRAFKNSFYELSQANMVDENAGMIVVGLERIWNWTFKANQKIVDEKIEKLIEIRFIKSKDASEIKDIYLLEGNHFNIVLIKYDNYHVISYLMIS